MKNPAKKLVLALLGLTAALSLSAQTTIKGVVSDENGEPLMGAGVFVEGTTIGVVTGLDGDYEITVPADAKNLVFSFIGLADQTVPIGGRTEIDVTMKEDANFLDEVVVVGYATVSRRDVMGSVSSVNSEALTQVPVATVTEAMSGKMAGVQITTTEGNPDADIKIRVRGAGSITQDSSPLYIVDGFPMESISDIPASDIQSIDVLKDAFSTAIYGSRGSNGVVIVTTKSGKEGRIQVNFNAYAGIKTMANKNAYVAQDAYDFVRTQYEWAAYRNSIPSYESRYGSFSDIDLYKGMATNDWIDQMFGRTGHNLNHNLSISGGSDVFKWTAGYAHFDETAIMLGSNFSRNNLNFKAQFTPSKKILFDVNVRYAHTKVAGAGANAINDRGSTTQSRLRNALVYSPIPAESIGADTDIEEDYASSIPPLIALKDSDTRQDRKQWTANGAFQWTIIPQLKLRIEGGLDEYRRTDDKFFGLTSYYVRNNANEQYRNSNPATELVDLTQRKIRNTNTLSYNFKELIPKNHSLDVLIGSEYIIKKSNTLDVLEEGLPSFFDSQTAWKFIDAGLYPRQILNKYANDDIILSFFTRVNYTLNDKYQFSATMRADGSSKFTRGNRWGYFPSAAVSWRISEEDFMKDTHSWLDNLKLRYSFGTSGNNNIPAGKTLQEFSPRYDGLISQSTVYWSASSDLANPDLKWETTWSHNLGVDYSFFRNRLYGSVEVYQSNTKDLLISFPVTGSGYANQYRNMGEIRNRGVEFTVGGAPVQNKNFGINVDANISFNQNRVISLGSMNVPIEASAGMFSESACNFIVKEGRPLGDIYGFVNDGIYTVEDFSSYNPVTGVWTLKDGVADSSGATGYAAVPGATKLKNFTDDTVVNNDDVQFLGNVQPLFTGGFSISSYLYDFDLSANFTYSYGNKVYNANVVDFSTIRGNFGQNVINTMSPDKRWTNVDWTTGELISDPAELSRINAGRTAPAPYNTRRLAQSYALEDASFLRLGSLTLGYTLPEKLTQKIHVQKLRVYATGSNLFCLTPYSGYDPEVDTRTRTPLTPNVDYSAYPKSRGVVFGVNLTFGAGGNSPAKAVAASAAEVKEVIKEVIKEKIVEKPVVKEVVKEVKVPVGATLDGSYEDDLFFLIGKAELRPEEAFKLGQICQILKDNPEAKIAITGYADSGTGTSDINMTLSQQRAAVVANMLKKAGIAASRITSAAAGTDKDISKSPESNRVAVCIVK